MTTPIIILSLLVGPLVILHLAGRIRGKQHLRVGQRVESLLKSPSS